MLDLLSGKSLLHPDDDCDLETDKKENRKEEKRKTKETKNKEKKGKKAKQTKKAEQTKVVEQTNGAEQKNVEEQANVGEQKKVADEKNTQAASTVDNAIAPGRISYSDNVLHATGPQEDHNSVKEPGLTTVDDIYKEDHDLPVDYGMQIDVPEDPSHALSVCNLSMNEQGKWRLTFFSAALPMLNCTASCSSLDDLSTPVIDRSEPKTPPKSNLRRDRASAFCVCFMSSEFHKTHLQRSLASSPEIITKKQRIDMGIDVNTPILPPSQVLKQPYFSETPKLELHAKQTTGKSIQRQAPIQWLRGSSHWVGPSRPSSSQGKFSFIHYFIHG